MIDTVRFAQQQELTGFVPCLFYFVFIFEGQVLFDHILFDNFTGGSDGLLSTKQRTAAPLPSHPIIGIM